MYPNPPGWNSKIHRGIMIWYILWAKLSYNIHWGGPNPHYQAVEHFRVDSVGVLRILYYLFLLCFIDYKVSFILAFGTIKEGNILCLITLISSQKISFLTYMSSAGFKFTGHLWIWCHLNILTFPKN